MRHYVITTRLLTLPCRAEDCPPVGGLGANKICPYNNDRPASSQPRRRAIGLEFDETSDERARAAAVGLQTPGPGLQTEGPGL